MRTPYIEHRKDANYNYAAPFHPSKHYPEYPWGAGCLDITENSAYDMVRETIFQLGLDADNYGKVCWNPFGSFVHPGMTVLIKPNMVLSWHPGGEDPHLDTMITNPSVVRAVVDYVAIALKGSGTIIIGDAPLQSCDFDKLISSMGYDEMHGFYMSKGVELRYVDFRQVRSRYNDDGILETSEAPGDPLGYLLVKMGEQSAHSDVRSYHKNFRVTNYDHRKMSDYHTDDDDSYLISKSALAADVIITMPKLKTHRKAGMTASMKNFIGIIGHKDCLPHHRKGSLQEGGDEYLKPNKFKRIAVFFEEWFNIFSIANWTWAARTFRGWSQRAWGKAWKLDTDPFSEGSWYGNDTIWRTTHDLVRIALFADKEGRLKKERQRVVFAVVDAIVAGEKEGPLLASPKRAGVIAGGFDLPALDMALAAVMGFDSKKIPTIREAFLNNRYPLTDLLQKDVVIKSGNMKWDAKKAETISRSDSLMFVPTSGWNGHLENTK